MPVTIYHNPKCSNSRRCLEIIRERGFDPVIVEYLKFPPARTELKEIVERMGASVRNIIRTKEPAYSGLALSSATDAELLAAIAANPILLNRPIVVTERGARLCRPPDLVRELL